MVVVDAQTGGALARCCMTYSLSDAAYNVYTSDSPSPFSPGHSQPLTTQPSVTSRTVVTWPALSTVASPNGWINDGDNITMGNNIDAVRDWNNVVTQWGDPNAYRATGNNRVFNFSLDLSTAPTTYADAAVVNLFYWCNWMHDQLYALGFDEAAGNYQQVTFGRGGVGGDGILASAQTGCQLSPPLRNNSYFSPTYSTDGTHALIHMYVWTGPQPWRDGDLDADIICHEYTHAMTGRLVGKGNPLWGNQVNSMNEGWADFVALSLLGQANDDVRACYVHSGYSPYLIDTTFTTNYYFGTRRYPYSTDLTKNPLTLVDISTHADPHVGVPKTPQVICVTSNPLEVHNAGQVWGMMLWEARANIIDRYRADLGDMTQGYEQGNRAMLQLVVDGQKLAPLYPSFLQARDAILQADRVNNGGKHLNELWAAFAKRGMGYGASSPDYYNSENWPIVESYAMPPQGGKKWEFVTGNGIYSSPALAQDGTADATLYVGSSDCKVYAINANTGAKRWEFGGDLGGWSFHSSPAVGTDGTVYVGCHDWRVYALTSAGVKRWAYYAGGAVFSSPAIGDDGTVYVGVVRTGANVLALNPADGTVVWSYATGNTIYSSPAIASDGTVYVGSTDGKLYAIRLGVKQWDYLTGGTIYSSPAIGADGAIYVGSYDGKLYCLNSNGTKRWDFNTGGIIHSSPTLGADGSIYVGAQGGYLYCLNSNGTQRWAYSPGGSYEASASPALGGDGTVFIGVESGILYAVTNGVMKWSYYGGGFSSPVIGDDGTVYAGSMGGKLTAISNVVSRAESNWPMFRQSKIHRASWPKSAAYLGMDSATQGNWRDTYHDHYIYGAEGFHLMGGENFAGITPTMAYPTYAVVEPINVLPNIWLNGTPDARALRTGFTQSSRIAGYACPFSGTTWSLDLDLRDNQPHKVALYLLDWDYVSRAATIDIVDGDTGSVLSTVNRSGVYTGNYLVWRLKGHVRVDISASTGAQAILSGIFFDPY